MMRAAVSVLLAVSAQGATVSGTVYLRAGQDRRPLAGVRVTARAADGGDLLEASESDAQGRYALADVPRRRIALSAGKRGYFPRAIASGEERLILDCAADEALAGADFELFPGSVITGRITDSLGEPLQDVLVGAWRITYYGGRHRLPTAAAAATDDRGVYRLFGLQPGRYILLARPTRRLGEQRAVAVYYPGRSEETQAEEIEAAPGREVTGIDLTIGAEISYRIAGKVIDVERDQLRNTYIQIATADRAPGAVSTLSGVHADGDFTISGLPAGSYVLTASQRSPGFGGPGRTDRILARQRIDLRGNINGLLIRPTRPSSLSGRVVLLETERSRPKPDRVLVRIIEAGGFQAAEADARAPGYRFEASSLWPGTYEFELAAPAGAYLNKVTQSGTRLDPPEVTLTEAGAAAVELEVAFGLGRVRGMVKGPRGAPLAHARVALARISAAKPSGAPSSSSVSFRTAQADQRGNWILPDARPGEYRICAWPGVDVDALYAPETWERAGRAVKRFTVEPGAEVEVELTAVDPRVAAPPARAQ